MALWTCHERIHNPGAAACPGRRTRHGHGVPLEPSPALPILLSTRSARVRRVSAVRLKRGVYTLASSDLARAAAALHGLHDAALSRQAAAWLLTGGRVGLPREVEVVTPPGSRSRLAGAHEGSLLPGEVFEVAGLRTTSPLRTALDVARLLPRRPALSSLDALTNTGCVGLAQIEDAVSRLRGGRGVVQARARIPEIEPRSESVRETWLRLVMVDGGLPRPRAQLRIMGEGATFLGWADLGYARLRLLLEYLGQQAHAGRLASDAARTKLLGDEGFLIVPFTNVDLRQEQELPGLVRRAAQRQYDALRLRGPLWVPDYDREESRRPRDRPGRLAPSRREVAAVTPRR